MTHLDKFDLFPVTDFLVFNRDFLKTIIYLSLWRICDQFCEDVKSINGSNTITSVLTVLILKIMMRMFILYMPIAWFKENLEILCFEFAVGRVILLWACVLIC
jgi:hypothetical protein